MTERDPKLVDVFERAASGMPPAFVSYADVMERTRSYRLRRIGTVSLAAAMFLLAGLAAVPAIRNVENVDRVSPPRYGSAAKAPTPTDVARLWVDSIGAGDFRGAWELLGPVSRGHYGNYSAFEDEAKAWVEGVGAWSDAPRTDWYETSIVSSGEGTLYAVTVAGAVSVDQQATTSWIVRAIEGEDPKIETHTHGAFIQPVVPAGEPVSQDRAGATTIAKLPSRPTFRAEVASSAHLVTFSIVDLDRPPIDYGPPEVDGGYGYAEWRPNKPLPEGVHVIQMVVEHPDGGIAAASALFEVGE